MTKLTRAGFIIAIAGGLLTVAPFLAEPYMLTKLFALALGAALAWAGLIGRSPRGTALDLPLAALWLVMLASAAGSVDPAVSALGMYPQQFYGLLPLLPCVALFYAAAACDGAEAEEFVSKIFVRTAIALSAFGLVQLAAMRVMLTRDVLSAQRATSTIGSPVMLGGCLALLLPFVLREALEKKSRAGRTAAALLLATLVLTWARGSWASAAIAALVYVLLTGRLKLRAREGLALGLICALAAAPAFLVLQRALHKNASDSMRVEMLKTAAPMLHDRPWLGSGPDTYMIPFRRYRTDRWIQLNHLTEMVQASAHNDFLQAATTLGWTGLAAYLWLLAALAWELKRRLAARPRDAFLAATAAGLTGLFLQAKVNPVIPSAIALAAVAAGLALRRSAPAPREAGRALSALAALALACAVALLARLNYADYLFGRGVDQINAAPGVDAAFMSGVDDLRRSTELNPWSLGYLMQRCQAILSISRVAPPDERRQLIDKVLLLAEEGIRVHPGNPSAHELRSTALAFASRFGANRQPEAMAEAMAEIKIAAEMDPASTFTLRLRMDLARSVDDRAEFEKAKADYLRVIALTGENPNWDSLVP